MPRSDPSPDLPASVEGSRMLDTKQMAAATRYCPTHLRRLVKAGKFPRPVKIGSRFLWPASTLVDLAGGARAPEGKTADQTEPMQVHHDVREDGDGT